MLVDCDVNIAHTADAVKGIFKFIQETFAQRKLHSITTPKSAITVCAVVISIDKQNEEDHYFIVFFNVGARFASKRVTLPLKEARRTHKIVEFGRNSVFLSSDGFFGGG